MRTMTGNAVCFGLILVAACSTRATEPTAASYAAVEIAAASPSTDGTPGIASADDATKRPTFPGAKPTGWEKSATLKPGATEDFLAWIATVPADKSEIIRQRIASASDDQGVARELVSKLLELPVRDTGRHVVLLSVIGEMRNSAAIEPLGTFIWWKGELTTQAKASGVDDSDYAPPDQTALLQSRAVEMLAYLGGAYAKADEATLKVAAEHPLRAVRLAAIDSYAWNHGDSDVAKTTLARLVSKDDAKYIGIPRKTRHMSEAQKKDFDQRVAAFYEAHPEELPPTPAKD